MTLQEAWNELHDSVPPGWYIGTPAFNERRGEWSMYAFDTTEKRRAKLFARQVRTTAGANMC